MITLWLTAGILAATSSEPTAPKPGASFGWGGSDVQRIGDTRWKGVREAREAAAAAFREVEEAKPARRKAAARKAAEAVADVAQKLVPNIRAPEPAIAAQDGWFEVLQDLEALQGILAAMADAERIRAEQARAAAAQWARIEAELVENALEEELLIVMALAFWGIPCTDTP